MDKTDPNTQNVLDMSKLQPQTGYAAIAQVEAYWEAIRTGDAIPRRSDIDPRGIELALANAFILERIAPGHARMRIAGNHVNDLMGMEARGMPLTSLFAPAARASISDLLEVVFQTPAVGSLRLVSSTSHRRPQLDGRLILLPLRSDLGDVSRALGCLVSRGEMGDAPRRFEITAKSERPVTSGFQPLPESAAPPRPASQDQAFGMAESAAPFEGKPASNRPPYLRLVKSDE